MSTEQARPWRVSGYGGNGTGNCVEVAPLVDGGVLVRDTKHRSIAPMRSTAGAWDAFGGGVKGGEFDF